MCSLLMTLPTGDRDRHAHYPVSYKATPCCHSANPTALRDTEDAQDVTDARAERVNYRYSFQETHSQPGVVTTHGISVL